MTKKLYIGVIFSGSSYISVGCHVARSVAEAKGKAVEMFYTATPDKKIDNLEVLTVSDKTLRNILDELKSDV